MNADVDVIVVGSGPAGVSTCFPLLEAGLKVLLVDGGKKSNIKLPSGQYLTQRSKNEDQWKWMIGQNFQTLKNTSMVSPKLRTPTHDYVFDGFNETNKINANGFISVGSLASGGLSNAWGCGVAKLSSDELKEFPFSATDIEASYKTVSMRMGLSGASHDDLTDYFGLDAWSDSPIKMDDLHTKILDRYTLQKTHITSLGFRLGRSRVAALNKQYGERKACDLSGNCLWGCDRRALYSATEDLEALKKYTNFIHRSGFIVNRIVKAGQYGAIEGVDQNGYQTLTARRIVLAAGTLATTRLALEAINFTGIVTMRSCPTAAFMLWLPTALGSARSASFGLGQLSFLLSMQENLSGFGSLFNPTGIPVAEFVKYMPLRKRYGIDIFQALLSSCVIGNFFLPGHLTDLTASLSADGALQVEGKHKEEVVDLMKNAQQKLKKIFWKMGAWLLPNSFTVAQPGSDIHYAASLPMREHPVRGETNAFGELIGFSGVHIVDGASLSSLSEKAHTLTIMANADRIGRKLVSELT